MENEFNLGRDQDESAMSMDRRPMTKRLLELVSSILPKMSSPTTDAENEARFSLEDQEEI